MFQIFVAAENSLSSLLTFQDASERGLLSIRRAFHDPDLGADSGNSTKPIIASLLRIDGRTDGDFVVEKTSRSSQRHFD